MPLEVIGAGFGRTGTLSTKAALETLGFAPCYHFVEILQPRPGHNEGHRKAWVDFMKGRSAMDWQWLFGHYTATLDFPTCFFYRELMEAFPDAKVLLTVRDPERWFESFAAMHRALRRIRFAGLYSANVRAIHSIGKRVNRRLGSERIDREAWIAGFERHNREVIETVPAERLLVYEVGQGWEPLCEFLGRPEPAEPYPHLNEGEELQSRVVSAYVMGRKGVFSTDSPADPPERDSR